MFNQSMQSTVVTFHKATSLHIGAKYVATGKIIPCFNNPALRAGTPDSVFRRVKSSRVCFKRGMLLHAFPLENQRTA